MGIKTLMKYFFGSYSSISEKPPHHMGIKTFAIKTNICSQPHSEKPPHHMGIKTGQQ